MSDKPGFAITDEEAAEVIAASDPVETKVYEWTVLKFDDRDVDEGGVLWREVGKITTDTSYYIGWDAPQQIGALGGTGEYLLLHDGRFERMTLTAETRYSQVEEES